MKFLTSAYYGRHSVSITMCYWVSLRCVGIVGEHQHPSNVEGQGRTNKTKVLLSNMYPNTQYEIIVVSGSGNIQSNASSLIRYTSK